jgi:transposase
VDVILSCMKRNYRAYNPNQDYLLPPSPKEWIPEGDLAHFISDTIEALDLREFHSRYREDGKGNVPYDPRMMLKVLVYSYSVGIFSSRKIARGIERDVALRMLSAGNFPDHRTINRFRGEHLGSFKGMFVQVVRLAQEVGLVKLGTIAIDGSKVKANASKRKAMTYGRMKEEEKRLRKEISKLLKRAQEIDEEEDELYGEENRGDELPKELRRREERLEKIREAKARLEARQVEEDQKAGRDKDDDKPENRSGRTGPNYKRKFGQPAESKQENFTDSESRIMKTSATGFQQCYNAQIAVDEECHIIVAEDVENNAADNNNLIPMIDQVKRNTKRKPKNTLADSGYKSEENFQRLKRRRIKGYISLGREGSDTQAEISQDLKLTKAMRRRLTGKRGKMMYRKRKWIAEPPFGWIKRVMGFDSFSLRSKSKVKGEWSLVCLAANLRRLNNRMEWVPSG